MWYADFPDDLLVFVGSASQIEDLRAERVSDPARYDELITLCEDDIRQAACDVLDDAAV